MSKITTEKKKELIISSITQLADVLGDKIIIGDNENLRTILKTKYSAFDEARAFLVLLQKIDVKEDIRWYEETITKLINSANKAIDGMIDIMDYDIKGTSTEQNQIIQSKQEAYNYITSMTIGISELQSILISIEEKGEIEKIDTNEYKSGFAEKFSYSGKCKKGEPGLLDDGSVSISYDGTTGETIETYGLCITLPAAPRKVEGYRRKPKDQYWRRPRLPKGLNKTTEQEFEDVITEEFRRRDQGYWFMNNGKPEYITGAHYMLLTHLRTDADGGYFHFRKAHRDLFYFLEASWVDDRSLGTILGKTRRTGASMVALAFCLTKGISITDANFGMTSKTDRDARRLFERLSHAFKHMPSFFKPVNTGEALSTSLVFRAPSKRTTKEGIEIEYDELNTVIDYQATTEDSYDSMAVKFYIGDEISKWTKYSTVEHWRKIRKALMKGGRIHGKAFLLSTVEYYTGKEYNDDEARAGDMFRHLYDGSRINERMENGMTKTGLYKIFISAIDNYEGFIDLYGNCISETPKEPVMGVDGKLIRIGARQYIEALWEPYKDDPDALNNEKRKDPIIESDMFRIASKNSLFNLVKIQEQIDYNDYYELSNGKPGYITGNLVYADNNPDNPIEFIERSDGRFMFAYNYISLSEIQNKHTFKNGNIYPAFDYAGAIGIDPYKVSKVAYGTGSKGAIVGYLGEHPLPDIPKEQFFMVYIGRPQSLEVFFEDAIKAMRFCSMQALIERNVDELVKVMYTRGLTGYSMRRPDKIKLTLDERMYGGIPGNNPYLLSTQASFLERYIENHIGYATDTRYRDIGEIGYCPFNNLLYDMSTFDLTNRTFSDATVAACLAVYGAHKFILKNTEAKGFQKVSDFYYLYSN